jgi:hypothetical protein
MTGLARLWPDDYAAAVLRKFCPGALAELAALILALAARMVSALTELAAVPIARPVAAVVFPAGPAVVWSAPSGADSMTTGPPCMARGSPLTEQP